jgi:hypothetical protein
MSGLLKRKPEHGVVTRTFGDPSFGPQTVEQGTEGWKIFQILESSGDDFITPFG